MYTHTDINNVQSWYKNGELHRDNDLPAVIDYYTSTKAWYKDGKLHRDNDLPAVISEYDLDITTKWYKNGQLHRDNDLPAVIIIEDSEYRLTTKKEWWVNGKNQNDYNNIQLLQIINKLNNLNLPDIQKTIEEYKPRLSVYTDEYGHKHTVKEWFYDNKVVKIEDSYVDSYEEEDLEDSDSDVDM